jgi:hypothetical protein
MRPRLGQDRRGRAVQRQDLDHRANVAPLVRTGVEFAVAVRTRAALAEAVVAVWVHVAVKVQSLEVPASRLHAFAAFDDQRSDAAPRELVGAKQARGAAAHHDHPTRSSNAPWVGFGELERGACSWTFAFRSSCDRQGQVKAHAPSAAIERAPKQAYACKRLGIGAQLFRQPCAQ